MLPSSPQILHKGIYIDLYSQSFITSIPKLNGIRSKKQWIKISGKFYFIIHIGKKYNNPKIEWDKIKKLMDKNIWQILPYNTFWKKKITVPQYMVN